MNPQKRTAYHESGHGLAANALGLGIDSITIIPRPGAGGQCQPKIAARNVRERLILLLAGPMAILLLDPEAKELARQSGGYDFAEVRELVEDLLQRGISRAAVNQTIRDCAGEAERILRGNWSAVIELAGKLMESGELVAKV